MEHSFVGIDYGSKLAGTTVIAYIDVGGSLAFEQSLKKKDADEWLLDLLQNLSPSNIFIDAPLSLPGVFQKLPGFSDYFFRQADRELKAMSPMFLGGLTARAMALSHKWSSFMEAPFIETYPSALAQLLQLKPIGYKKEKSNIRKVLEMLRPHCPYQVPEELENWHKVDALLAFISGHRFLQGQHQAFGHPEEGIIIV